MTTRVEMLNTHTNRQRIRVREVSVGYGDNATDPTVRLLDSNPGVEAQPGQRVTGKISHGQRALLVELVPEGPHERELPAETAEA